MPIHSPKPFRTKSIEPIHLELLQPFVAEFELV